MCIKSHCDTDRSTVADGHSSAILRNKASSTKIGNVVSCCGALNSGAQSGECAAISEPKILIEVSGGDSIAHGQTHAGVGNQTPVVALQTHMVNVDDGISTTESGNDS